VVIVGKPLKPGRIPCVIGGCGRTGAAEKYPGHTELLCSKCFRHAPRYLKKRFRRLERIMDRMGVTGWTGTKPGSKERTVLILHDRTWKHLIAKIVEAKAGIA